MTPPIAICGGGPCGLTLACLLERSNVDYVLYERDPASAPADHRRAGVGGTLDLHPGSGQRALQSAGLFEEFKKHARYDATGFALLTSDGDVKERVGEGRDAPEIDRHQLRQMLLDSVPAERIQWDHWVKAVEQDANGHWTIAFANGSKAEGFKMVVGADGAWSKVRSILTSSKPVFSGAHYLEGRINPDNPSYDAAVEMVGKGNSLSVGGQKALMVQQMADTSYRVYMGVLAPADFAAGVGANTESVREEMLNSNFASWSPKLKRFIKDAEGPFKPWPLHSLPLEGAKWPRVPGVTLLGDAAHLTTPNGEGVNLAMEDALILSEKLVEHCGEASGGVTEQGLEKAIAEYEEEMFPKAAAHIQDGNHMIDMFFAENAIDKWMRAFGAGSHDKAFQLD